MNQAYVERHSKALIRALEEFHEAHPDVKRTPDPFRDMPWQDLSLILQRAGELSRA